VHHDFLDRHSRLDTPIHHAPAGVKLAAAFAVLLAVVLVPFEHAVWLAPIAAGLALVAAASRVPPGYLVRRLLAMEPFVLGISILSLLQPGGVTVFLRLVTRGTLCLFTVLLLSSTTPFGEILRVLRRLRLPSIFVTTLALMYRYLFVLVDEGQRMSRARASRTFRRRRTGLWKANASVIGELFVRSTERAERIYAAMTARGWKT
jgi:cobalt/nickel transport system permease protein